MLEITKMALSRKHTSSKAKQSLYIQSSQIPHIPKYQSLKYAWLFFQQGPCINSGAFSKNDIKFLHRWRKEKEQNLKRRHEKAQFEKNLTRCLQAQKKRDEPAFLPRLFPTLSVHLAVNAF